MIDLTISIVNWNTKNYLKQCLQSIIEKIVDIAYEIIVVDNNSEDGSVDMVQSNFPEIKLIRNNTNFGFAKASNQAYKISSGKYILLLNPDIEIVNSAVQGMIDFMESNPRVGALGPKLITSNGNLDPSCRNIPNFFTDFVESSFLDILFPKSKFFNYLKMGNWNHNQIREVEQLKGACILFRREALEKSGFMDEQFFMYYEEVDLCYRIKKTGCKIYFLPRVEVIHHGGGSAKQIESEAIYQRLKSKIKFFRKHYGNKAKVILKLNLIIRTFLIYTIGALSYYLFSRPRYWRNLKRETILAWKAYQEAI